jgi:hypothetical protein
MLRLLTIFVAGQAQNFAHVLDDRPALQGRAGRLLGRVRKVLDEPELDGWIESTARASSSNVNGYFLLGIAKGRFDY